MPKSLLLMFDLDGTLTDSMGVDSDAFAAALRQWLGTAEVDENWGAYRQHSDRGIALEAFERRFDRAPLDDDMQKFQALYATVLESRLRAQPDRLVGIGLGEHADALTSAGAAVVLPHYPEPHTFLEAVRAAV